jgi:hypothetical protein
MQRESRRRPVARLRAQLAGDNPDTIERLLDECTSLPWLDFYQATILLCQYEFRMTGRRAPTASAARTGHIAA